MKFSAIFKRFLPPEDRRFYALFEEAAELCFLSSELFHEIMEGRAEAGASDRALGLKNRSSAVVKETLTLLNSVFITPLDREDIVEIAFLLNKITKRIIRGCVNLRTYRLEKYPQFMLAQSETLVCATTELKVAISHIRNQPDVRKLAESNILMMEIESRGDAIFHDAMEDLFSAPHDATEVIKLRDVYKTIESALDTCSTISETATNIIMKQG